MINLLTMPYFSSRWNKYTFFGDTYRFEYQLGEIPVTRKEKTILLAKWLLHRPYELLPQKGVFFNYLEMPVTTGCTLKCKDCSNLMQYYRKHIVISEDQIVSDIEDLLSCVDGIYCFGVLGGEPLLYPHLKAVLNTLVSSDKVKHIQIVTNGTLLPKPETEEILKDKKVVVLVSDYHELSTKTQEWEALKNRGINVIIRDADEFWRDYGDMTEMKRSRRQLCKQMVRCATVCFSYLNGKIYRCPRAAHGNDLGMIRLRAKESVEIRGHRASTVARKQIRKLQKLDYSEACRYCNRGTSDFVRIRAALQADSKET